MTKIGTHTQEFDTDRLLSIWVNDMFFAESRNYGKI